MTLAARLVGALGAILDAAMPPPPAPTRAPRADGWASAVTGLGSSSFDRTTHVTYGLVRVMLPRELEALYRKHGIARKIIDAPIEDGLRPGYEVLVSNDEGDALEQAILDAAREVQVFDDSLAPPSGLLGAVQLGASAADLFGGAVLIGLFEGDDDLSQPLGAFSRLEGVIVLDRWSCQPMRAEGTRRVEYWQLGSASSVASSRARAGARVHPSRVIPIMGARLTSSIHSQTDGWGDSRLQRVIDTLSRDGVAEQTVGHLAEEAVVGKYKIPGLKTLIAENGLDGIRSFLRVQALARSAFNAAVIDADGGGDYTTDKVDFSGLVAILEAFPERVAAAAEIPMMRLYGKSAPGMNSTGEADLRNYYDLVDARYRGETGKLTVTLRHLLRWLMMGTGGPTGGEVVPFTIQWGALWTPTPLDEAQRRYAVAQADAIYIQTGVITPDEVAASRFSGRTYSSETALDVEARAAFSAAQEAESAAMNTPPGSAGPTQEPSNG